MVTWRGGGRLAQAAVFELYPSLCLLVFQFTGSVGIITPYRGQLDLLNRKLRNAFPPALADFARRIEVNTVDGFQVGTNILPAFRAPLLCIAAEYIGKLTRVHLGLCTTQGREKDIIIRALPAPPLAASLHLLAFRLTPHPHPAPMHARVPQ